MAIAHPNCPDDPTHMHATDLPRSEWSVQTARLSAGDKQNSASTWCPKLLVKLAKKGCKLGIPIRDDTRWHSVQSYNLCYIHFCILLDRIGCLYQNEVGGFGQSIYHHLMTRDYSDILSLLFVFFLHFYICPCSVCIYFHAFLLFLVFLVCFLNLLVF